MIILFKGWEVYMSQENIQVKTPEFVSLQFQSAGLGSRATAFIIDQFIVFVAYVLFLVAAVYTIDAFENVFNETTWVPLAIFIVMTLVINWGYFFLFEYFGNGRTIGKMIIGIRVIQENGHSITLLSSFIRNLLRIIDQLPSGYLLGILLIFFHSKHKRLGDLAAGTIVVHERRARKKKRTAIEKEINARGIIKTDWQLDEWTIKSFNEKDWQLMKTYTDRYKQIPLNEREALTRKVAEILLVKAGVEVAEKSTSELERRLFVLYLHLKEEWEFE